MNLILIISRFFRKLPIATRVLLLILVCGLFFAVAETSVQLYLDYKSTLEDVEDNMELVKTSSIKSITKSTWNLEVDEVLLQLEGALQLKYIEHLEVIMENGEVLASAGTQPQGAYLSREYPLIYEQHGRTHVVGEVVITAGFGDMYQRLYRKMVVIMMTRVLITLCMSGIFLFIFRYVVSRHLTQMAHYTQNLDFNTLGAPLVLNRGNPYADKPDELEQVVQALNHMQVRLRENISQIKATQAALKESESKYRNLFESSMDAIILLDPDDGYIDCNQAALDLFGIDKKETFLTLTPADLSPRSQPDQALSSEKAGQMIALALEKGSNLFEWTHKKFDGETFVANVLATRITLDGRVVLLGTIRDITDYKRSQEMLVQSEKMMSVGGLAAGMAHEINNPLAGMMQNAQVIKNRLTKDIPANHQVAQELGTDMDTIEQFMLKRGILNQLDNIHGAGTKAAKIIDNMLSFAKKTDASRSKVKLDELMDKTIALAENDYSLKKKYDFKQIRIVRDYNPHVPAVLCEPSKIQQVLFNLIKNASEAIRESASDKPPEIVLRLKKEAEFACMEVEDNGPGIDPKTLKRIFEPFFTTKPVDKGTGLGLSVSYFIVVDDHRGKMEVVSTMGKGTRFIIKLPME